MKTVVLLDTSIASNNMGDEIIMRSAEAYLDNRLFNDFYKLRYPTHTNAFTFYSARRWEKAEIVRNSDLKFIFGTDLLAKDMFHSINLWNIQLWNCSPLKGTITVGCGCSLEDRKHINRYTKRLYNKVLSHDYIHSTRDEETKLFLEAMGFHAVVTGCPTLWMLTPSFCQAIPHTKADSVVFTLSGTAKDYKRDQYLINILKKNYTKVYFWVQTVFDLDYLYELNNIDRIEILNVDLNGYSRFLNAHSDIDYVGIRLHGGIYAMQHGKRSVIISIDHRARNININNHLNCIEREAIEDLEYLINSNIITQVSVDYTTIANWINQFNNEEAKNDLHPIFK